MATLQSHKPRDQPPLRRPTAEEIKQAEQASHRLESAMARTGADQRPTIRLTMGDGTESNLEFPALALTLLDLNLPEEMPWPSNRSDPS